jgi:hypothetical protein
MFSFLVEFLYNLCNVKELLFYSKFENHDFPNFLQMFQFLDCSSTTLLFEKGMIFLKD